MSVLFVDSSALAKCYVEEVGTPWMHWLTATAGAAYVSGLARVEVSSALARRARSGSLDPDLAREASARLARDLTSFYVSIEPGAALLRSAASLAESLGLRGMDAIQLATAIDLAASARTVNESVLLVSSDVELNAAAARAGLIVENPADHP